MAGLFPWIDSPYRIARAWDIPTPFLYDLQAPTDSLNLGIPLLAAAAILLALVFVPSLTWLRKGIAFVVLAAAVAVVVQWGRFLHQAGTTESLLSFIGIGVYATVVAATLLMVAPARRAGA
ncbi:MAG: hypothetical protein KQH83_05945 [Actinobacteria bacterium]|nr:hypothetical protein [Actinomycetota bacterium]